jgi:transcriptional regulator with XRE-family HTH domain
VHQTQSMRLGYAARRRRTALGLTRLEASRRAGIALGTLKSIERGEARRRTHHVLKQLACALEVNDLDELAAAELLEHEPIGTGPSTCPPPSDEDELDVDALDAVDPVVDADDQEDANVTNKTGCTCFAEHELLQFFTFEHLKPELRNASQPFCEVAREYAHTGKLDHQKLAEHIEGLPANCERDAARVRARGAFMYAELGAPDLALRGLLEAKDCAVRAVVWRSTSCSAGL